MTFELARELTRLDVPYLDGVIRRSARDLVRVEIFDVTHRLSMAAERLHGLCESTKIEEVHLVIDAPDGDAVRALGRVLHAAHVGLHIDLVHTVRLIGAPNLYQIIIRTAHQQFRVDARVIDGPNTFFVLFEIDDGALLLDVPHGDDAFVIARRDVLLRKLVVGQARQFGTRGDFRRRVVRAPEDALEVVELYALRHASRGEVFARTVEFDATDGYVRAGRVGVGVELGGDGQFRVPLEDGLGLVRSLTLPGGRGPDIGSP